MEVYYTKKEYNEMKSVLSRKLAASEKKNAKLEKKLEEYGAKIAELEADNDDLEEQLYEVWDDEVDTQEGETPEE